MGQLGLGVSQDRFNIKPAHGVQREMEQSESPDEFNKRKSLGDAINKYRKSMGLKQVYIKDVSRELTITMVREMSKDDLRKYKNKVFSCVDETINKLKTVSLDLNMLNESRNYPVIESKFKQYSVEELITLNTCELDYNTHHIIVQIDKKIELLLKFKSNI